MRGTLKLDLVQLPLGLEQYLGENAALSSFRLEICRSETKQKLDMIKMLLSYKSVQEVHIGM